MLAKLGKRSFSFFCTSLSSISRLVQERELVLLMVVVVLKSGYTTGLDLGSGLLAGCRPRPGRPPIEQKTPGPDILPLQAISSSGCSF